ncbi:MAG: hypothetical protein ACXACH_06730, partial [Candidatus Hermodarchaeia archaeon]
RRLRAYMDSRGTQELSQMCVVDVDITEDLGSDQPTEPLTKISSDETDEPSDTYIVRNDND